jgi:hypothetical protein
MTNARLSVDHGGRPDRYALLLGQGETIDAVMVDEKFGEWCAVEVDR